MVDVKNKDQYERGAGKVEMGVPFAAVTSGERRQGALSPVIINEAKRNKTRGRFLLVNTQEQLRSTCGKRHRKGLKSKGAKMLATDVMTEEDVLGISKNSLFQDQEEAIKSQKCIA